MYSFFFSATPASRVYKLVVGGKKKKKKKKKKEETNYPVSVADKN